MAGYELISEREESGCWIYEFDLKEGNEYLSRHQLRLAWADYDLWVRGGSVEPTCVADAILRFVLGNQAFDPLPRKIDSSHPRRLVQGADQMISSLIKDISP